MMIMDEKTLKYVKNSSYRCKVIKSIGTTVKIPKEISEDSGILLNHISTVLSELKEKDLVECICPNLRKGRLYRLSDDGLEILDELK